MKEFYQVNLRIYYLDLLISTSIFGVLFVRLLFEINLFVFSITLIASSLALYRAAAFVHELCHQHKNKKIKLFKSIWNLTVGFIILYPSIKFKEPHLKHHKIGVFGTVNDPQYILYGKPKNFFCLFILFPWLNPIVNLLIVLLAPFVINEFVLKIYNRLDSLVYANNYSRAESKEIDLLSAYYFVLLAFIGSLKLPIKFFVLWYLVVAIGGIFSTLRVPLEHSLKEYFTESNKETQLKDSYTFKSHKIVAFLIQPLGLRYHTAHHLYPRVPYHNLKKAEGRRQRAEGGGRMER